MAGAKNRPPSSYDLPNSNELEVSLFGPGYGECLVIHYGDGRWFTVDSCLEDDRETPSALAYLHRLGVDPAKSVTHNVVTHPDGDHVGGISKLFSECSSARLVCPTILAEDEMVSYITFYARNDPAPLTQKTRELYESLKLSTERAPNVPLYVKQDTLIVGGGDVRVTALAPADSKIQRFLGRVSQDKPKANTDRRAPGKLLPNDVSLALLLEMEGFSAVFGADLEETPGGGWSTILDYSIAFENAVTPRIYKIAHHGSDDADCPRLWQAMDRPFAILAPFKRGRHQIPTPTDVDRILSETGTAFSTSSFKTVSVKRLSRVDRILTEHGIRRQDLYPRNGHIRLRVDTDSTIRYDLFQNAVHLSQVN